MRTSILAFFALVALVGGGCDSDNPAPAPDFSVRPDMAVAPPDMVPGKTGCNGFLNCGNNCGTLTGAAQTTCVNNCQANTTMQGVLLFFKIDACAVGQCVGMDGGGGCTAAEQQYYDTAGAMGTKPSATCLTCVNALDPQTVATACNSFFLACQADKP